MCEDVILSAIHFSFFLKSSETLETPLVLTYLLPFNAKILMASTFFWASEEESKQIQEKNYSKWHQNIQQEDLDLY